MVVSVFVDHCGFYTCCCTVLTMVIQPFMEYKTHNLKGLSFFSLLAINRFSVANPSDFQLSLKSFKSTFPVKL